LLRAPRGAPREALMRAALFLALCVTGGAAPASDASARWRCEPAAVEVGQPFELVLELVHAADASAFALLQGEPAFDDSWVVLARQPERQLERGAQSTTSEIRWSVASLEPGPRDLSAALGAVAFSEDVKSIQVGAARVDVSGVLLPDEDEPRPLREFPEHFGTAGDAAASPVWPWVAAAAALGSLALWIAFVRRRRARAARPAAELSPLERLGELERRSGSPDPALPASQSSEPLRQGCYELTRLLRDVADRARSKNRSGLTDEEWLAELKASLDVTSGAVEELGAVFERAGRVKYAGQAATPWAVQETFARARSALQALGAAGSPAGAAR